MKCLIIAAGKGERIRDLHDPKPLLPLAGRPLIERVMRSACEGGATEFVVVSGYQGERLRAFLDGLVDRTGMTVTHLVNEAWNRPNGMSVALARGEIAEPFLLTMADHIFDPHIVRDLLAEPIADDETILAVDYRLDNPLVDADDATRARVENGRIRRLGKGIEVYDAFDTGIFYATPALFDALLEKTNSSLSDGMNVLAERGSARAFDIGARFWLDVDDPRAAHIAERYLETTGSSADRLAS